MICIKAKKWKQVSKNNKKKKCNNRKEIPTPTTLNSVNNIELWIGRVMNKNNKSTTFAFLF